MLRFAKRLGLVGLGGGCLLMAAVAGWVSYDLLWKLPRLLSQSAAAGGGSGVILHDTFILTAGGVEIPSGWIPYLGMAAGIVAVALGMAGMGWLRAAADARDRSGA